MMTGTVTTADGKTLVGIFKNKIADIYGYSSIAVANTGNIREKIFELWEVI